MGDVRSGPYFSAPAPGMNSPYSCDLARWFSEASHDRFAEASAINPQEPWRAYPRRSIPEAIGTLIGYLRPGCFLCWRADTEHEDNVDEAIIFAGMDDLNLLSSLDCERLNRAGVSFFQEQGFLIHCDRDEIPAAILEREVRVDA